MWLAVSILGKTHIEDVVILWLGITWGNGSKSKWIDSLGISIANLQY